MFVRRKTRNGETYHYLVKSVRQDGKVRQKTLVYLGEYPTVEAALEGLPKDVALFTQRAAEWRQNWGEYKATHRIYSYQKNHFEGYIRGCEREARRRQDRLARLKDVVGKTHQVGRRGLGTTQTHQSHE